MAGKEQKPLLDVDIPFDTNAQLKLETAHDVIQHPDKFAEIFVKAATSQTSIKEYIKKEIKDSLTLDPELRGVLKGLVKEQLKEDWKGFVRSTGGKIAFAIWSVGLIIFTAWISSKFGK